jgi:hypothetical protein
VLVVAIVGAVVTGLAPGPWGRAWERCTLCGQAGALRIRHGGEVDVWHKDRAERYFAAMADPPVKVPDPLDENGDDDEP